MKLTVGIASKAIRIKGGPPVLHKDHRIHAAKTLKMIARWIANVITDIRDAEKVRRVLMEKNAKP